MLSSKVTAVFSLMLSLLLALILVEFVSAKSLSLHTFWLRGSAGKGQHRRAQQYQGPVAVDTDTYSFTVGSGQEDEDENETARRSRDEASPTAADEPTEGPTHSPTRAPTEDPSEFPTQAPTGYPTEAPTESPTAGPTDFPTDSPTEAPTTPTTENPTTGNPTGSPTEVPTAGPTESPTAKNTESPTEDPTVAPTANLVDCGDGNADDDYVLVLEAEGNKTVLEKGKVTANGEISVTVGCLENHNDLDGGSQVSVNRRSQDEPAEGGNDEANLEEEEDCGCDDDTVQVVEAEGNKTVIEEEGVTAYQEISVTTGNVGAGDDNNEDDGVPGNDADDDSLGGEMPVAEVDTYRRSQPGTDDPHDSDAEEYNVEGGGDASTQAPVLSGQEATTSPNTDNEEDCDCDEDTVLVLEAEGNKTRIEGEQLTVNQEISVTATTQRNRNADATVNNEG